MRLRLPALLALAALLAGCTAPAPRPDAPAAVPATTLSAPPADWAALAGQRVRITAPLTVVDSFALESRGELRVAFDGRVSIPTEVAAPGAEATAQAADNARRQLRLDDGLDTAPPDPANPLPAVPGATALRAGSVLAGVEGTVVVDARGARLVPERVATIARAPRPAAPVVAGRIRLASFNVLNLFNGDGQGGGFPTARGARTPEELARQQAKLVAAVQALAPDAAALMEIENDGFGPQSAIAQFVAALNAAGPIADYRFVDAGEGPGTNAIRVAIIYRASRLAARGAPATLAGGPFDTLSRVPLAQHFVPVAAVHFKSKGCGRDADAATGAEADLGDGQACWNPTRVESARRLVDWLRADPTRSGTDRVVVLGDFNAYAREAPLAVLHDAGFVEAFDRFPEDGATYSFVFDGAAGRLDHAWLSPSAAALLRGAAHWHSNADEPASADYRAGTDMSAYGASDHDPLVIGLDLGP
jgi:predicted extracellular nuclease